MKLPKGITMNTIFASGLQTGAEIYMPLKWVLKHGNIPAAIVKVKEDLRGAIVSKDKDYAALLEKKLSVLEAI